MLFSAFITKPESTNELDHAPSQRPARSARVRRVLGNFEAMVYLHSITHSQSLTHREWRRTSALLCHIPPCYASAKHQRAARGFVVAHGAVSHNRNRCGGSVEVYSYFALDRLVEDVNPCHDTLATFRLAALAAPNDRPGDSQGLGKRGSPPAQLKRP